MSTTHPKVPRADVRAWGQHDLPSAWIENDEEGDAWAWIHGDDLAAFPSQGDRIYASRVEDGTRVVYEVTT